MEYKEDFNLQPRSRISTTPDLSQFIDDYVKIEEILDFKLCDFENLCAQTFSMFQESGTAARMYLDEITTLLKNWRSKIIENRINVKIFIKYFEDHYIGDVMYSFINPDLSTLYPASIFSNFDIYTAILSGIHFLNIISYFDLDQFKSFLEGGQVFEILYKLFINDEFNYDKTVSGEILATMINISPIEAKFPDPFPNFQECFESVSELLRVFCKNGLPYCFLIRLLYNVSEILPFVFDLETLQYIRITIGQLMDEDDFYFALRFAFNLVKENPKLSPFFFDFLGRYYHDILDFQLDTISHAFRLLNLFVIELPDQIVLQIFDLFEDINSVFERIFSSSATAHQGLIFFSEISSRTVNGELLLMKFLHDMDITIENICSNVLEASELISIYGKSEVVTFFSALLENYNGANALCVEYLDPGLLSEIMQRGEDYLCLRSLKLLYAMINYVNAQGSENINHYIDVMNDCDIPEQVESLIDSENEEISFMATAITERVQSILERNESN